MIFSPNDLDTISTNPSELGLAALKREDSRAALDIARQSINAHFAVRDIYTSWNGLTLNYIEQVYGREQLIQCLTEGLRTVLRPWVEWFRNGISREAVSQFAQICRMDAGRIEGIIETDTEICFSLKNWMGARWRDLSGAPEFSLMNDCMQRLCIEWLGYPPFILQWEQGSEQAALVFYKDPVLLPSAVFERLGLVPDKRRIATAFSLAGARMFAEAELDALRFQAYERAAQCIDAGELAQAEGHFCFARSEWYLAHHFIRDWVTGMTTWLHREHGDQAVWDCVDETYNKPTMGAMLKQLEYIEIRDQVQMLAAIFHQHGMKFSLKETEAGIEFKTAPCGSGGRLIDELAYDAPKQFSTVAGPSPLSFGLDQMPVYCMHCPGTNKLILESDGPYFALVEPDVDLEGKLRGHCSFHIFHNKDAIPDAMYHRLAMDRPGAAGLEFVKIVE